MPEPPDFASIARAVFFHTQRHDEFIVPRIVEQLRVVWNARGAADLALIDPLTAQWGDDDAYGSELLAARAHLRALDR